MERVKVEAWMQMGVERRETAFEVAQVGSPQLHESLVDEAVHGWYRSQLLWGWIGLDVHRVPPELELPWRIRYEDFGSALQHAIRNTRFVRLPEPHVLSNNNSGGPVQGVRLDKAHGPNWLEEITANRWSMFMWAQLGVERRETLVELSRDYPGIGSLAEYSRESSIAAALGDRLWDWLYVQFGRGYTTDGYEVDEGFMEGRSEEGGGVNYPVTTEQSVPNTRYLRLVELKSQPA